MIGRPRGFVTQGHVHPSQEERHEVIAGADGLALGKSKRVYGVGETFAVPPGTPHRHFPAGSGEGHVRVELRPALRTEQFLERLAELDRAGQITKRGLLKPVAAARMIAEFEQEGHASRPPVALQKAFASTVLGLASIGDRTTGEYVFVDEWDVRAPREVVFEALADGRTYPEWWKPVYISVEADGPPKVGAVSRQEFKGKLPYHLKTIVDDRRDTSRRTASSQTSSATCAGAASGRSPTAATASRTSASTGRSSPTASCCARSRRCCGRPSARTTTGRSPVRWRDSSRTRSARRPCRITPGRAERGSAA